MFVWAAYVLINPLCFASDVGVTGAQFLKIGTGARPMGMAGAFTAVADDGYAGYWNPAGFARNQNHEIASTYLNYFEDIDFGFLGYNQPYKNWGVFGLYLSHYFSFIFIVSVHCID